MSQNCLGQVSGDWIEANEIERIAHAEKLPNLEARNSLELDEWWKDKPSIWQYQEQFFPQFYCH